MPMQPTIKFDYDELITATGCAFCATLLVALFFKQALKRKSKYNAEKGNFISQMSNRHDVIRLGVLDRSGASPAASDEAASRVLRQQ